MRPKVIFFTKTRWNEAPRLRHQVANLIIEMGYDIIFFERPSYKTWFNIVEDNHITFIRHFEIVHHRLRFFKFLVKINEFGAKFFIRKAQKKLNLASYPIINFSYDYYFIKDMFQSKVVTIIDDDFVNKLKNPLIKRSTKAQLAKTAKISDINWAVSYPLRDQLLQFTEKVGLFFPWAEEKYKNPETTNKRDVALFFGYINYRLNWPLILEIARKGVKIRFIGPIERTANKQYLSILKSISNVEFLPSMRIFDVNFSDVCCSILPWDDSYEGVRAITINNKCFNLLSYGLPQVYTDLPNLIEADSRVIRKCTNAENFVESIHYFSSHFQECQKPIKDFLENHYSEQRKSQLQNFFSY